MNQAYRVIWSQVKHGYVVVSELAKSHTKNGGHAAYKQSMALLCAAFLCSGYGAVMAADNTAGEGKGVAVGTGSSAPNAENIAVGKGAKILYSNGLTAATGDVAIGSGAKINNYASQGGSIAIGKNAQIENMAGGGEASFAFGQTTFSGGAFSLSRIPADPTKVVGSVAIGDNTFARTGSTMIGSHNYNGELGDTTVNSDSTRKHALSVYATTIGANSFSNGAFTTSTGAYNIISSEYNGGRFSNAVKNLGATINVSLNSIESMKGSYYSGIANTISGIANRTFNSNGTLIYGAGNEITNSITGLTGVPKNSGNSAKEFADKLRKAIADSESGGATFAIGGGNKADYTQKTSIIGVNNKVNGTKDAVSIYNFISGYKNTATKVQHVSVIGSENTVTDTKGSLVLGDKRTVSQADGSIILGSSEKGTTTGAKNAVAIGSEANVTKDGGVALGAESKAITDKGIWGVDVSKNAAMTADALLGDKKAEYDAAKTKLQTLQEEEKNLAKLVDESNKAVPLDLAKNKELKEQWEEKQKEVAAQVIETNNYVKTWQSTEAAVSVGDAANGITRQITGVAAGTEDTDAVNVAQLKALNTKMDQGAIHYYSVTSDKKAAGSNFANDGAKAADSMVIGIGSTSEGINSTVVGNNNTLKGGKRDADGVHRNNSIVVGESIEVEGTHNAVFGTDYMNMDRKLTKVAGEQNTVVGVGNLVGYTAEKDFSNPRDMKWTYTKWKGRGSDANVAVGMTNTVNGGSVVLGTSSEIKDGATLATSVGHANTIQGSEQYGLALGNKLLVEGYGSIAVGTESKATADYATAIGTEAVAEQEGSIAFGDAAEAKNKDSVAFGSFANAKARSGVAIGSSSLADREKGIKGYLAGKDDESEIWKSTRGAVSVGNKEKKYTRQIIGVAAGSEDTDAVNVAQLKKVQELAAAKTTIEAGDNIKVEAGTAPGSYKISAADTTLKEDTNALSFKDNKLNLSIEDTKGNKVTGSVDLKTIQNAVDTNTTYTMTGTENKDNTTTISLKDSAGKEQKVTVATKDTNTYTTGGTYDAATKKLKFTQNDQAKNYEIDVSAMINDVVDTDTRNTIVGSDTVEVDATNTNQDGSINYKLNVKTDGKVEKDNKGVINGGTVYKETRIEKDGTYIKEINTAGENLTILDKQVGVNTTNITNLGNRVGELDTRVNKVGAGAAALAALHPMDFDPDDKWDFAVGYGNYKDAHAAAVGAYYRPNEDTLFSVGGSFGGGENMVNAGVSWKFGQRNHISRSRVSMAKDMLAMKHQIEMLTKKLEAYETGKPAGRVTASAGSMMFPDVPENHWAYEYVKLLAERGYLTGYPDGEFKGDRAMTRYEYAAIIYRALQNGAPSDGAMVRSVDEFGSELVKVQNIDRFRVDRISGKDNDRNKVERVRINDKDNAEKNDYRDVYGSRITK